jgi:hypothetical protein
VSKYKKDEIYVHEIYHSRNNFKELSIGDKYKILTALYDMINTIPFVAITVGIHNRVCMLYVPNGIYSMFHGHL